MTDTLSPPATTATPDTAHDRRFAYLVAVAGDRKAELVDGEVHIMSPTGGRPARAGYAITRSLDAYARAHGGEAYPDNVTYMVDLPGRQSFSPDASYFTGPVPPPNDLGPLVGAPVFAAEVRSESDYGGPRTEARLARKRADYFAGGTLVVWDVDLLGDDTVRVYRADRPDAPDVYGRGEVAEAEPAVPGWRFAVDELFA